MSRQTEIGEILARIAGLSQIHDFRWLVLNGLPKSNSFTVTRKSAKLATSTCSWTNTIRRR